MSLGRWITTLVIAVALLILPAIKPRKFCDLSFATCTTKADAHAAIDLMKDWGTWLTGIQTGAIAALALLVRRRTAAASAAVIAVVLFGSSIIADTALLAGLPSMSLRLSAPAKAASCADCNRCAACPPLTSPQRADAVVDQPDRLNDIYEMKLFDFVPFRLGFAYMLSHWYFILGMVAFGVTFAIDITSTPPPRRTLLPVAIVRSSFRARSLAAGRTRGQVKPGNRAGLRDDGKRS